MTRPDCPDWSARSIGSPTVDCVTSKRSPARSLMACPEKYGNVGHGSEWHVVIPTEDAVPRDNPTTRQSSSHTWGGPFLLAFSCCNGAISRELAGVMEHCRWRSSDAVRLAGHAAGSMGPKLPSLELMECSWHQIVKLTSQTTSRDIYSFPCAPICWSCFAGGLMAGQEFAAL